MGLPTKLSAFLLVLATFVVVAGIGAAIAVPASGWVAKAPEGFTILQDRLSLLKEPVAAIRQGLDQLTHLTEQTAPPGKRQTTVAVQQSPDLSGMGLSILMGTQHVMGRIFVLIVVLFFLLAAGDSFLRKLVEVIPSFHDKKHVVVISNEIESSVSNYLATITMINLLVAIANGIAMYACGLPDPLLWGTMAFLVNYVPLVGPMIGFIVIFVVGLLTSDTVTYAVFAGRYLPVDPSYRITTDHADAAGPPVHAGIRFSSSCRSSSGIGSGVRQAPSCPCPSWSSLKLSATVSPSSCRWAIFSKRHHPGD